MGRCKRSVTRITASLLGLAWYSGWESMATAEPTRQRLRFTNMQRQETGYCADRQIVVLELAVDPLGAVQDAIVIENHAGQREADSLLTLVHAWRVPAGPSQSRPKAIYVVAIAGRRADKEPATESLSRRAHQKFEDRPLALWLQALRAADPRASQLDFVTYHEGVSTSLRGQRALDGETMRRRQDFGMLHESPDGNYVLDPFAGSEVTEDGLLVHDAETGFSVFEKPSGDLRCYSLGTGDHLAAWVDATEFVLVGTSLTTCATGPDFLVPAIWFGDVEDCRVTCYLGDPMAPWQWEEYYARIRRARQEIYPRLRFDE